MTTQQKHALIGIAALAIAIVLPYALMYGSGETVLITVTNTERITTGDESKYLVFTIDETFENTDSIWFLKFDSSDIQGRLQPGQTYRADVYGWRIPFLSIYRNIVHVRPAPVGSVSRPNAYAEGYAHAINNEPMQDQLSWRTYDRTRYRHGYHDGRWQSFQDATEQSVEAKRPNTNNIRNL